MPIYVHLLLFAVGLVEQWRRMYSSADWLSGKTCATLLATIGGERERERRMQRLCGAVFL